ncbi:ion channel [Gracilimonas sediminicola]|uniref:Potassium channel family protein n=1 Tax=Gracilimonas sediminicola TaxID=2952158 RepID=A0A9X2L5J5_9BACT|nr:ion channel [Gracilimonas sediminicola]MCP9292727.1 potassium channel family protein [Gracilimonas sediminicola]
MKKFAKYFSEHIEAIVALGFVVWGFSYILGQEVELQDWYSFVLPILILMFCIYKSFYYVLYLKERIGLHYVSEKNFPKTVFATVLTLLSISVSFAVDYLLIDHFGENSFTGYTGTSIFSKIFDFVYFSVMTLTTLGYSGVEPTSYWAKSIAGIQVLTSFSIVVFLLANMGEIKPFKEEIDED